MKVFSPGVHYAAVVSSAGFLKLINCDIWFILLNFFMTSGILSTNDAWLHGYVEVF